MKELDLAHIWAATSPNGNNMQKLFKENQGDDGEPISEFAKSQGEWFYDHDFLFYENIESKNLETLLRDLDIPEQNARHIIAEWEKFAPSRANFIIAADSMDFKSPKSCDYNDCSVIYIGEFSYYRTD